MNNYEKELSKIELAYPCYVCMRGFRHNCMRYIGNCLEVDKYFMIQVMK